jgi:hypothetical protein
MNYFAHGIRFLDRPYYLAGTAIPDWLSIADRKVRMRSRLVKPFNETSTHEEAEISSGVLQHLKDDDWFHSSSAFNQTSRDLTVLFRQELKSDPELRAGFLGHIVTEILLDAVLARRHPQLLDRYYEAMAEVNPAMIENCVNKMAKNQTGRLAPLIPLFLKEEFLRDYVFPEKLWYRLNQVMKRVKLASLPEAFIQPLVTAEKMVEERAEDLLPVQYFQASL